LSARVFLGDVLVGELTPDAASQTTWLEFDSAYASQAARPVLGRWFEDQIIDAPRRFDGSPLPNYFRNLLPEGALRKIVELRLGPSAIPEYTMLLRLGQNLPGAVRVVSDDLDLSILENDERRGRSAGDPFRFALTGVQPKLSLSQQGDRLTVPLEGQDGHWVAKFGNSAFQKLVENEFAMLEWAKLCGLDVPEHRIITAREIQHLPENFDADQNVLIVRRFDRGEGGKRTHQEDFAQAFGIAPEEKYLNEVPDWVHYGSIGAAIAGLCGDHDYREYMRRLVFMVLSGNTDAHVKNWALVYPDALHARLAPAYDLVATVAYPAIPSHPALRWFEPNEPTADVGKSLESITIDDLLVAASYTELDTAAIMEDISEFAKKVRATWPEVAQTAPSVIRSRVADHLAATALV